MPEHIGNAGIKAMAWAKHTIVFFSPQAKRDKSVEKITQRHHRSFAGRRCLDVSTRGQTETFRAPASLMKIHSHTRTELPAPAQKMTPAKNQEGKVELAKASEQIIAKASAEKRPESIPQANAREVADRVYRLMQYDLILERDRTNKLGV